MNNANFIAMLGGGGLSGTTNDQSRKCNEIMRFKAGKMTTELLTTGKYLVKPDLRRGTINLSWEASIESSAGRSTESSNSVLLFEWKDRRTCATIDSFPILPSDNCTYTKVDTGREGDRVYLLQFGKSKDRRYFYWMQDNDIKNVDEENCVKINMYMCDPDEVALASKNTNSAKDENSNTMLSRSENISRIDSRKLGMSGLNNDTLIEIIQGLRGETLAESGEQSNASDKPFIVSGVSGISGQQKTINQTPLARSRIESATLSNILKVMGLSQTKNDISLSVPNSNPSTVANCTSSVTLENETNSKPTSLYLTLANSPPTILLPNKDKAVTFSNLPKEIKAPSFCSDETSENATNLTLVDLQGAMTKLITSSPCSGIPWLSLTRLTCMEMIEKSGILKCEAVRARLLKFLPEQQRTDESIIEHLRSPQVAQCLRDLTSIICNVDDEESMRDYNDLLVNFQLNPEDRVSSIGSKSPLYGFLECIMKKVEREKSSQKLSQNETNDDKECLPEDNVENVDMSEE